MVFVITITNSTQFQTITTKIGNIYVRKYQNPTTQANLEDDFLISLKAGDVLSVTGAAHYKFYVYN